jgi:hypothetical protein
MPDQSQLLGQNPDISSATVAIPSSLVVYQPQIPTATLLAREMPLSLVALEIDSTFTNAPTARVRVSISQSMDLVAATQRLPLVARWLVRLQVQKT